ncbi:MAG: DUF4386 domain-containing protein [Acidimicrobiia bacterium]
MQPVNQPKRTATTVGLLFILATVAGVISVALLGSTLDTPVALENVAAAETDIVVAALFSLLLAAAVIAIPVLLFPILRLQSDRVARGYFAFRILEGVVIVLGAISLLTLVTVSQESAEGASGFWAVGAALVAAHDWTDVVGTQLVFGVTALILNLSMFRSLLVPRFISIWGIVGAALVVFLSLAIILFDLDPFSTTSIILFLPIAVQEMVMAIWFIVKGFDLSAMTAENSTTDRSQPPVTSESR